MLKVVGARVLVQREEAKDEINGILLPDSAKEKPLLGTVKAVGDGAWTDAGKKLPMSVKVGDRVMFAAFAGAEVEDTDGTKYVLLNERDIMAIVEG